MAKHNPSLIAKIFDKGGSKLISMDLVATPMMFALEFLMTALRPMAGNPEFQAASFNLVKPGGGGGRGEEYTDGSDEVCLVHLSYWSFCLQLMISGIPRNIYESKHL